MLVDLFGYLSIVVHGLTILSQSMALGGVLFLALLAHPLAPKLGRTGPRIVTGTACVAGYAAIAVLSFFLKSWAAVILWLAPMLVMKFVHQLQNTIEHLGLPHDDDTLVNTRSTRTNAVLRWMAWQMPYHTAHHVFPGVPFHRLHELNKILFTDRGAVPPTMTYWGFQLAALRAFAGGKTEADHPQDRAWIVE